MPCQTTASRANAALPTCLALPDSSNNCWCVMRAQVKPMIEIMKLSQVNEAMDRVAANKARYK